MSDVERLLTHYIAEHRASGDADPIAYMDQLEGTDRAELAALIDGYLQRAPGREWDPEAFRGSPAAALSESIHRSLAGQAGAWPALLPRLRERAQVKRSELAERLAEALGVGGSEEKVAAYYHEMERGTLSASGVSGRVLGALGAIVGASAESLRRAGEGAAAGPATGAADAVFARTASPAPAHAEDRASPAEAERAPASVGEWDEVDELFRGGA